MEKIEQNKSANSSRRFVYLIYRQYQIFSKSLKHKLYYIWWAQTTQIEIKLRFLLLFCRHCTWTWLFSFSSAVDFFLFCSYTKVCYMQFSFIVKGIFITFEFIHFLLISSHGVVFMLHASNFRMISDNEIGF